MKRGPGSIVLAFGGLLLAAQASGQVLRSTIPDLVEEAAIIVRGRVERTEARWIANERGRHIHTTAYVNVAEVVKGSVTPGLLSLTIVGGTVGDTTEYVSDAVAFAQGEEALLFLKGNPPSVIGGHQGKVLIVEGRAYVGTTRVLARDMLERIRVQVKDPSRLVDLETIGSPSLSPHAPARTIRPTKMPFKSDRDSSLRNEDAPTLLLDTGTIYDAWWEEEIDSDSDGYRSSAILTWDPDVNSETGSLNVFEEIYWKPSGSDTWTLGLTIDPHVIDGYSVDDVQRVLVESGSRGLYDWRIILYRVGVLVADFTSDPSNDPDLNDYPIESVEEDGANPPEILSMTPLKAPAGTGATVTISGVGFGDVQGSGLVEFFYRNGAPRIQAPIVSWSRTQIVCQVPTDVVDGYLASASSGPVTIATATQTSNGYTFRVSFGNGGVRWPGTKPAVLFRINENTADCAGEGAAVRAAAASWNAAGAAMTFVYDGTHTSQTAGGNGVNEILWGSTEGSIATSYLFFVGSTFLECDIVFDDAEYLWSAAQTPLYNAMDVQTIALHELGHWLCLRDIYGNIGDGVHDAAKIMYGFGSNGMVKRDLHTDDIAGIQWIYGTAETTVSIPVDGGWNIVSCPVQPADMRVTAVFPEAVSGAFSYSNGYIAASTLTPGMGYWLKFPNERVCSVKGASAGLWSVGVPLGWNLIGPLEAETPSSLIVSEPDGIIASPFFGYSGGYTSAITLLPGRGYWVKTSAAGMLRLGPGLPEAEPAESPIQAVPSVVLVFRGADGQERKLYLGTNEEGSQKSELPPPPPLGIMDVRFAGNAAVEQLGTDRHEIFLSSVVAPFTVMANGLGDGTLKLRDSDRGTLLELELCDGKTVRIQNEFSRLLILEGEGSPSLPQAFTLAQNYPNPFNPSTTIRYGLPRRSRVTLTIFNALGEQVAVLREGEQEAGYHDAAFDASDLASGVYLYRFQAGDFVQTKKLVVVR